MAPGSNDGAASFTHGSVFHRRLEPVGYRSCVQLLSSGRLGRVIYTSGALPAAQPVGYVIDAGEVVFSTDRGSVLDLAVTGAVVAFEVDDIDVDAQHGWSVLAVGRAYAVTDPCRLGAWRDGFPIRRGSVRTP